MQFILIIFTLFFKVSLISSHPQCLDFYPPFENSEDLTFCSMYYELSCCTVERDNELYDEYLAITRKMSDENPSYCVDYIRDILCQECSPYAAHLYDSETTGTIRPLPGLCNHYCIYFHSLCSNVIPLLTEDSHLRKMGKRGSVEFCDAVEIPDMDYCYPNILDNADLNSELDRALGGIGDGCLCLEEFANGLRNPVLAVHANDSTHRLYVAEQLGIIHVYLRNGSRIDKPFLDLRKAVLTSTRRGDERGLLGLAFHPNYKENNRLFVFYTTTDEETDTDTVRVSEFSTKVNNGNRVDTKSEKVILQVVEPAANHNGGQMLFGTDGYLYVSIGDGGKAGDPFGKYGNAQNMTNLLGKILRIDVDSEDDGKNYAIPPTNPFVYRNKNRTRHEIYAYGVRNMWRCGMDAGDLETGEGRGRIICGDVGQSAYEEVDIIISGGNYGWRAKEGFECYDEEMCDDPQWLVDEVLPIHAYPHTVGKSVIGGHIYRGCLFPNMNGHYIYGDFMNGRLFKLVENNGTWENSDICLGDSIHCYSPGLDFLGSNEVIKLSFLRRNPSECPINEEGFPIKGTITPFTPSKPKPQYITCMSDGSSMGFSHRNIKLVHLHRPGITTCPKTCNTPLMTNVTYCRSSFAIVVQIQKVSVFNRYKEIKVLVPYLYRLDKGVRRPDYEDTLIAYGRSRKCPCPNFQVGMTYIITGRYERSTKEFVVSELSVVQRWYWYWNIQLYAYLNTCNKASSLQWEDNEN
ncbi:HHIP-like protein 2 [Anneissia japonica]|uniref:HHIP-like protein 2 n=1 Tax=Anneissia japonica TaxID=1529436 RepID=UPI001425B405|nr:HHIP-like protein 2 [Anneissia japonica]